MRQAEAVGARDRPAGRAADRAIRITRAILADLFGLPARRSFAVRLWDGSVEGPAAGPPPRFTLVLRRAGALRHLLLPPSELAVGEAFLRDDIDVEGDLEEATGLADALVERLGSPVVLARLLPRLLALPTNDLPSGEHGDIGRAFPDRAGRQSGRHDAVAVRFHYELPNDFYALWLDRRMIYSAAYFSTGAEDIDAAQTAKLEQICRKLRLEPGERLLDIGCGWGGLIQYAAERYGVRAVGITLSRAQAELANRRIAEAGLDDRCRVEVRDYRALPPGPTFGPTFDKVVSIEMYEHCGRAQAPAYFAQVQRVIKPGGLFLLQGTTAIEFQGWARRLLWRQGAFRKRYVLPDLQPEFLTAGEVIHLAEEAGFETRDVESLREHCPLTIRRWLRRLETRHDEAARLIGESVYRVWRLYLATAARGFAIGRTGSIQALFSKPYRDGSCRLPLTRADLYREAPDRTVGGGP